MLPRDPSTPHLHAHAPQASATTCRAKHAMAQATSTSTDPWLGYGNLVALLVAAHVLALFVWLYLVTFSNRPGAKPTHQD